MAGGGDPPAAGAYPSIAEVVTHSEVTPGRIETGPAFPVDRVRSKTAGAPD
jgi:N-acetyl-anhydromuramyl-L-alanine amidase AmpD